MARRVTLYELLDVMPNATQKEITTSFRRMAKTHHPDKNIGNAEAATEKFRSILDAYKVLSDEASRKHYDDTNQNHIRKWRIAKETSSSPQKAAKKLSAKSAKPNPFPWVLKRKASDGEDTSQPSPDDLSLFERRLRYYDYYNKGAYRESPPRAEPPPPKPKVIVRQKPFIPPANDSSIFARRRKYYDSLRSKSIKQPSPRPETPSLPKKEGSNQSPVQDQPFPWASKGNAPVREKVFQSPPQAESSSTKNNEYFNFSNSKGVNQSPPRPSTPSLSKKKGSKRVSSDSQDFYHAEPFNDSYRNYSFSNNKGVNQPPSRPNTPSLSKNEGFSKPPLAAEPLKTKRKASDREGVNQTIQAESPSSSKRLKVSNRKNVNQPPSQAETTSWSTKEYSNQPLPWTTVPAPPSHHIRSTCRRSGNPKQFTMSWWSGSYSEIDGKLPVGHRFPVRAPLTRSAAEHENAQNAWTDRLELEKAHLYPKFVERGCFTDLQRRVICPHSWYTTQLIYDAKEACEQCALKSQTLYECPHCRAVLCVHCHTMTAWRIGLYPCVDRLT